MEGRARSKNTRESDPAFSDIAKIALSTKKKYIHEQERTHYAYLFAKFEDEKQPRDSNSIHTAERDEYMGGGSYVPC